MTIPIVPGPFSFLASGGQALGAHGIERERQRQQGIKEAYDKLRFALEARAKGVGDPAYFQSAEAMDAMRTLGLLGAVSPSLTSAEQGEQMTRDILSQGQGPSVPIPSLMGPQGPVAQATVPGKRTASPTTEQRIVAGLPTGQQVKEAELGGAVAGRKLAGVEGGGAVGRLLSGVPSTEVAEAGEAASVAQLEGQRDQFYLSQAGRTVDAIMTQQGIDPLKLAQGGPATIKAIADQAWQLVQQDARTEGYTPSPVTRTYIEAMIASRVREAQALETARVAASRQFSGSGAGLDDMLRLYQMLLTSVNDQIKTQPEPTPQDRNMASLYASELADAKDDQKKLRELRESPKYSYLRQKYEEVQLYDETVERLNRERTQHRGDVGRVLDQTIPGLRGGRPGGRLLSDADIDALVDAISRGDATIEHAFGLLEDGDISDADYREMAQRLARRRNRGRP